MPNIAKRKQKWAEVVDRETEYDLTEAVMKMRECASAKFDESIEVAINLGVDPKHADQQVRGVTGLPNGTGKTVRIAVFAKDEKADAAKAAGADLVGTDELVKDIQAGKIDFDRCIATPDCMPIVGKVAKILGPKGLMPNPKIGTVTPTPEKAVEAAKAGQVEFRVEKNGIIHVGVGKMSFADEKIAENIKAIVEAVRSAKPSGAKGTYMERVAISSSMGPGIKVTLSSVTA